MYKQETNRLVKTARTYFLCDKENEKLVKFRMIMLPKRFLIIDTELLQSKAEMLLPQIIDATNQNDNQSEVDLRMYMYLLQHQRDYQVTGYLLDDFIVKTLQLNKEVTNLGRLKGMEYLIDLLHYHFYDDETGCYVTCNEPGTISFFHEVPCWERLLIDLPVTYTEVLETKKGSNNYVSVS